MVGMRNWFRRRRGGTEVGSEPATAAPAPTGIFDERKLLGAEPAELAERFWQRWSALLPEVHAALGDRAPQRVEQLLCEVVADLHPELQFAVERGQRANYALVLTGQEDPKLRPYTDAWLARAPAEDLLWEYHDSVPPVPDPTEVTVNLGEHRLPLAEVRVAVQVDTAEQLVDVAVHHPRLADLTESAKQTMTFLPLDATLGERLAAERLRRVETAEAEPAGAVTLLELRTVVRGLAGLPDSPQSDSPQSDSTQSEARPPQDP
ncbi:hypothetical protein EV191_106256 [Tamaricihabitans halophyticus]|uniref:Uncharacterized protein n=1 Tax=Tamaricihabitans halophyticus TaxID=1262583 RepID=A0A4R2QQR7_9PSEU|nr:hypothetical protein [Tamaricihabitans halophyticus]TCP52090.1 hypothetical protein EV191_106256 [Tamaricihabitans halophyticus]